VDGHLKDPRDARFVSQPFLELVRTALLLVLAQGWADQKDADFLRADPELRLAVSLRRGTTPDVGEAAGAAGGLALQPTLSRLLAALARPENRPGLSALLLALAERRLGPLAARLTEAVLDMDSLPLEVHGSSPAAPTTATTG